MHEFFDDGSSVGEQDVVIPEAVGNAKANPIPISYPKASYEIVFVYTLLSTDGGKKSLGALSTESILGKSTKFKISTYRSLNVHFRSAVVKGSTFNVRWDQGNAPFLISARIMRRKYDGYKFQTETKAGRFLSDANSDWQTEQGKSCVPFKWKNRMHFDCTSGPRPKEFNGKPWCATKVDPQSKVPILYGLCARRSDLGRAAVNQYMNSDGRYFRWKVSENLAAGGNYHIQFINAFTGEAVARTNEFNVGCSSIDVKYEVEHRFSDLSLSEIHERIIASTKLPYEAIRMRRISQTVSRNLQVNVQLVTNGKEIDPKKCPLKRLYALASSEHVNASTMVYSTLDLWSEGEPVFDNFEGRPSIQVAWLTVGIVFAVLVVVLASCSFYVYQKQKGKMREVFGQWRAAKVDVRKTYFINKNTGETSWTAPQNYNPMFVGREARIQQPVGTIKTNINSKVADSKPITKKCANENNLPDGWHAGLTDDGEKFYWHDDNVTTSWEKPDWIPKGWKPVRESKIETDEDLLPGWHVGYTDDKDHAKFYYHDDNVSTSWELPDWVPENWVPNSDFFADPASEVSHRKVGKLFIQIKQKRVKCISIMKKRVKLRGSNRVIMKR